MWLLLCFSILLMSAGAQDGDTGLQDEECAPHSQPWQVALFEGGRFNCGASLISPQWVLSAAHCQSRFMRVRLGEHNLHKREGSEQLRAVSRVIPHPNHEARTHNHDVMLLKLARPVRLTREVRPLALPGRCPRPGEACMVSGWGLVLEEESKSRGSPTSQDSLHCANISIVSTESCNKEYPGRLRNAMVCAGAQDGDTDLQDEECAPHSQPWQVALFEGGRFNCGASLISPQWVLSAAHCQSRFMRVRLREHNLHKREGSEQLRAVSRVIPHPNHEARTHNHDVMLLKLARPVRLTREVRPLALPGRCPRPGEVCVVSGWGLVLEEESKSRGSPKSQVSLPDTLHCANISVVSTESCNKEYPGRLRNTMVCASVEGRGTDSCEGDSGGPLVCGGVLHGIVSWGDVPCDTTTKPGVYMKVCRYVEWIRETMRRN